MQIEGAKLYTPSADGRRPLVTGAGGSMAGSLVERLSQSVPVIAMARKEEDLNRLSQMPNVIPVFGDMNDPDSLERALEGVDTVFHLAASTSLNDWDQAQRVNIEGTENLARSSERQGVERVVLMSTVGVYGISREGMMDETTTHEATGAYGATKSKQEAILLESGVPVSIIRPTNVIGKDIDVWTHLVLNIINGIEIRNGLKSEQLKKLSRLGVRRIKPPFSLAGALTTNAIFSYVENENLIDLTITASQHPDAIGEAFNAVDENSTWSDVLEAYGKGVFDKTMHRPPKVVEGALSSLASNSLQVLGKVSRREGLAQMGGYLSGKGAKFSTQKADTLLGHTHRVSLAESVAQTREYVDTHGIIPSKQIYNS